MTENNDEAKDKNEFWRQMNQACQQDHADAQRPDDQKHHRAEMDVKKPWKVNHSDLDDDKP